MALSLAAAVTNKDADFLDDNTVLSGLARQKLFMITKPGKEVVTGLVTSFCPQCVDVVHSFGFWKINL